jgi:hypothetical protein
MRDKVYFSVDASNFARTSSDNASLIRLLNARDSLIRELDGRPHQIVLIADSNLHTKFGAIERTQYSKMIEAQEVTHAPSSSKGKADKPILKLARKHDGHAISGDGFLEHLEFKDWLQSPGKARLIGGLVDQVDKSWIFFERRLSKSENMSKEDRSLSEVLDDLYPTVRSVFRQLGQNSDQIRDFTTILDLPASETDIISQEDAERIRVAVRQLLEYRTDLKPLLRKSPVSEQECLQWLNLNNHHAVTRDGHHYVSDQAAIEVKAWLSGQFPTLSAFQLKLAMESEDIETAKRLINDLDFEGQEELVLLGRTWVSIAEGSASIDWAALETMDVNFLTLLVNEALKRNLVDHNFDLPGHRLVELMPPLNNRLLAKKFHSGNKHEDLIAFYSSYVGREEEDKNVQGDVGQWIVASAFSPSNKWSKRRWKSLSDVLSGCVPYSPEHVVCYYFSGNYERALVGEYANDKKLAERLRTHYLAEVISMPWMSSDSLGQFLMNPELKKFLISGDYESFLASEEVMETAIENVDAIASLESPWSDLVFAGAIELKLRPLSSSIDAAMKSLNNLTLESSQ